MKAERPAVESPSDWMEDDFLVSPARLWVFLLMLVYGVTLSAQPPEWWQQVHQYDGSKHWVDYMTFSSAYFGPNALPVPELPDARVALSHQVELSADLFWGYGDQTQSLSTQFTYVFIPGRLAINVSGVLLEHYKTTTAVRDYRASLIESAEETLLIGDYYISTQMALLREGRWKPDVSLDVVLKTASSNSPSGARFFDTPGYVLQVNAGKTVAVSGGFIDSLRLAANTGFLCYQTNHSNQNDAWLYGALLRLHHKRLSLEGGIGGYEGWIKGGKPLVLRSRVLWKVGSLNYFLGYQHALRDYPFRRIQTGVTVSF